MYSWSLLCLLPGSGSRGETRPCSAPGTAAQGRTQPRDRRRGRPAVRGISCPSDSPAGAGRGRRWVASPGPAPPARRGVAAAADLEVGVLGHATPPNAAGTPKSPATHASSPASRNILTGSPDTPEQAPPLDPVPQVGVNGDLLRDHHQPGHPPRHLHSVRDLIAAIGSSLTAGTTTATPSPGLRPPTSYSRLPAQVKEPRSHDTRWPPWSAACWYRRPRPCSARRTGGPPPRCAACTTGSACTRHPPRQPLTRAHPSRQCQPFLTLTQRRAVSWQAQRVRLAAGR
jgi:hypothetical protein